MEKFKQRFVDFRSGNKFIIGFASFLLTWAILRILFQFDFLSVNNLNLILSIEASLATSLLLDQSTKQAAIDREILEEIKEDVEEAQNP